MTPGKMDLDFVRGDDFELPNRLRLRNLDGSPGAYKDMAGYTGEAEIWHDGSKVGDIEVLIDTGITGRFVLSCPRATTATLPTSGCTWFLRFIDPSNKAKTWVAGDVRVKLPGNTGW